MFVIADSAPVMCTHKYYFFSNMSISAFTFCSKNYYKMNVKVNICIWFIIIHLTNSLAVHIYHNSSAHDIFLKCRSLVVLTLINISGFEVALLWEVVLHHWVIGAWHFETTMFLLLKIRSLGWLKMLSTDYPLMWHISVEWRPRLHCESLKNLHILAFIAIFMYCVHACT